MPEITLYDGQSNKLLDTNTFLTRSVVLRQHAMRYHVFDPETETATKQFVPEDEHLRSTIIDFAKNRYGTVSEMCRWIHVKNRSVELFDASKYRRIIQRDLRRWWGDKAVVTGTSIRDVYYVSDGNPESTPLMIGKYRRSPLVYKGKAVASIFTISGIDVLASDGCVVYWLPKPWWDGFHSRYRKDPIEFPWPTGFAFSNWCQRKGHANYANGVWIADMTQGQTVGQWSTTSLMQVHGNNIHKFSEKISLVNRDSINRNGAKRSRQMAMLSSTAIAPFGLIGAICTECRSLLEQPYHHCPCGKSNCISAMCDFYSCFCTRCGLPFRMCECKEPVHVVMGHSDHSHQYACLMRAIDGFFDVF